MQYFNNEIADFYRYRIPYQNKFFEHLASKLELTPRSRGLDICCGNGQVACGLANKFYRIDAVDESAEMLKRVQHRENITFLQHDINLGNLPRQISHHTYQYFMIGQAIHWIRRSAISQTIQNNLAPDGAIVTLGNIWSYQTPWLKTYYQLLKPYKTFDIYDTDGKQKLGKCGYRIDDSVVFLFPVRLDLKALYYQSVSYARYSEKIKKDDRNFQRTLTHHMTPYLQDGHLTGMALNWANIFRR